MKSAYLKISMVSFCGLLSCQSPSKDVDPNIIPTSSRSSSTFPDLSLEPLPPISQLTRKYYDKAYPHLTTEQLKMKWKAASQSPMMLMRSYVNVWYDEAALVSKLGPIGPCFGDAHVQNFGFLWNGAWIFTYNDLDDVGRCPVIFDALRFFTTVSLYIHDSFEEKTIRDAYLGFLNGEPLQIRVSDTHRPNADDLNEELLAHAVKKGQLVKKQGDVKVSDSDKTTIYAGVKASLPKPSHLSMLDVKEIVRSEGGSAGLTRYELLAKTPKGQLQLLELKELTEPGSERGPWAQDEKLTRAQFTQLLWGEQKPFYMTFPTIEGRSFQLRSQNKAGINLDEMQAAERVYLFIEEAYVMAQVHKLSLQGTPDLGRWLEMHAPYMVERYTQVVKNAH